MLLCLVSEGFCEDSQKMSFVAGMMVDPIPVHPYKLVRTVRELHKIDLLALAKPNILD